MRVDGETEERTMGCWSEGKEGRKVSGGHCGGFGRRLVVQLELS